MKRMFAVAASAVAFATSGAAMHAYSKDFVIVTVAQGAGSTNLDQAVAAAGGTLTGRQPDIGVAFASSDNAGFAFVPPDNRNVYFSHATHVSGIVAAPINGVGIAGVAPCAEIVNVKVLDSATGSGEFSWVINGIMYAAGSTVQADVINMSLG